MSNSKEVPSDVDGASCPSRCYDAILYTSFAVLPTDKPDIQLMGIMSEAFDRYQKEMPRGHLEAAMNWFMAYTKAKLSDDSSS